MQPIFDTELNQCEDDNFEFSTLMAAYISNMMYLSMNWVESNFGKIFDRKHLSNFICAVGGLAYIFVKFVFFFPVVKSRI